MTDIIPKYYIKLANGMFAEADNCVAVRLLARVAELEEQAASLPLVHARVTAIINWIEKNQPDAFRRGLWEAIMTAEPTPKP